MLPFDRMLTTLLPIADYTELHLVKHTISSYRECLAMPRHLRWLYMCAATKAVCNSSGLGHTVFDTAAPILKAQAPFAGWTPVQYDGDKPESFSDFLRAPFSYKPDGWPDGRPDGGIPMRP